jgi:DNA-binding transcriptional regulator GbsR (MarR family)
MAENPVRVAELVRKLELDLEAKDVVIRQMEEEYIVEGGDARHWHRRFKSEQQYHSQARLQWEAGTRELKLQVVALEAEIVRLQGLADDNLRKERDELKKEVQQQASELVHLRRMHAAQAETIGAVQKAVAPGLEKMRPAPYPSTTRELEQFHHIRAEFGD